MSLWRPHDECCTCGKLVGYAGDRARQSKLRRHLACACPTDAELDAQLTETIGDPMLKRRAA